MNKLLTIAAILAAGYASAGSVLIENLDISASRAATVTGGQSNLIAGAVQAEVDPHSMLVDGTRAMAANLPMGGQSITNLGNIQMGGYWQSLTGDGASTIDPTVIGASQSGVNGGTQSIGNAAYGASQSGVNFGTQSIGNAAYGASQSGRSSGTQSIGAESYGAKQIGRTVATATATNNAIGAMQLHNLTAGQHALTTSGGAASILLGAGVSSNKNAIVAGDGGSSNGDGSITATGGFHGDGTPLTGVTKPADLAAYVQTTAIPGPGCTDLGTATEITGATVTYRTAPTAAYVLAVTNTAPRYTYSLRVESTNAYTLASGLYEDDAITPTGTNVFVFVPDTGTVWRIYGRAR